MTSFCFLFSDPTVLGTTADWSSTGGVVTLAFPTSPAQSFSGTEGVDPLVLMGTHDETLGGDVWQYTQIFSGQLVGDQYSGSWSYGECNSTDDPASCPSDGFCVGSADFVMTITP
jgi:hypothetical protein